MLKPSTWLHVRLFFGPPHLAVQGVRFLSIWTIALEIPEEAKLIPRAVSPNLMIVGFLGLVVGGNLPVYPGVQPHYLFVHTSFYPTLRPLFGICRNWNLTSTIYFVLTEYNSPGAVLRMWDGRQTYSVYHIGTLGTLHQLLWLQFFSVYPLALALGRPLMPDSDPTWF